MANLFYLGGNYKMPRGTQLTMVERGKIDAFYESGLAIREIASRICRSKTLVHNYIILRENYGIKKRCGRKSRITDRDKREIIRLAVKESMSPAQIGQHLQLPIKKRRIRQILHETDHLKYMKRDARPRLLPRHKTARLRFAEIYKFWDEEWHNVIFSDEKKFSLDGPDGWQWYWGDTRQNRRTRQSRNFGGGSLMVWGAFCYTGRAPICFVSNKLNAAEYVNLLEHVLVEFGDDTLGQYWVFQQDNAAIHTARHTKSFFEECGIDILQWPAISPDLNPMENVWALLSNRVYHNGRQFETVTQLRNTIVTEWKNIDQSLLQNHINSMPRRLQQVILKSGGNTGY